MGHTLGILLILMHACIIKIQLIPQNMCRQFLLMPASFQNWFNAYMGRNKILSDSCLVHRITTAALCLSRLFWDRLHLTDHYCSIPLPGFQPHTHFCISINSNGYSGYKNEIKLYSHPSFILDLAILNTYWSFQECIRYTHNVAYDPIMVFLSK